jgi:hypothetical protein
MLKVAQPLDPTKKVIFLDHVSYYIHVIMLWCKIGDFVHVIDLQFDFLYCFYIQIMVSKLVLVRSFFHEKLLWSSIPFKLQFDVDMANSRLDVTRNDILIMTLILKPKHCVSIEFLGVAWEKRITFSYLL